MNAYILAGGASSRMGTDKSLLPHNGSTLLEHAITFLRPHCTEVALVGNHPHLAQYARTIRDHHTGCGPLAGIHAALLDTTTEWSLIFAVDVFAPDPRIVEVLASHAAAAKPDCFAVVPRLSDRPEPLCALYRKPFSALAQTALARGDYKVGALFPAAHALFLTETDFLKAGIAPELRNINTPDDYAQLLNQTP